MKSKMAALLGIVLLMLPTVTQIGCYAPLKSRAVPACQLPDTFRAPYRSGATKLNLSSLMQSSPTDVFMPGDTIEIKLPDLFDSESVDTMQVRISEDGTIYVPLVGPVAIGGLNFNQAHREIERVLGEDVLRSPRITLRLIEKSTINVVVLGAVNTPGTYELPREQADAAHALAAAGGLAERGSYQIEVHRKSAIGLPPEVQNNGSGSPPIELMDCNVERIDLRVCSGQTGTGTAQLSNGDAIYVPNRNNDVFYVVGNLHPQARTRFTIGNDDRELGGGFLLPPDRDVDVVTAVAMAGYLDPIESPTTVTIHRRDPFGESMLIKSDIIKARYDPRESIMIMPGDIIYLNPDASWYFRRLVDRTLPGILNASYRRILGLRQ